MNDSKTGGRLREVLTGNAARFIMALERAIADPGISADRRAEYREELGGVANRYANLDCFDDAFWEELKTENPNLDPLSDEEWREFITRHETGDR